MLYQLVLSPIQKPNQEKVLAVLKVNLEIFLLDSVTKRKKLDEKFGCFCLRFLVLL